MDRFLYKITSTFQSEKAVYHKLFIKNFYIQGGHYLNDNWISENKERTGVS